MKLKLAVNLGVRRFIRVEDFVPLGVFISALALNLYRISWLSLWGDEVFSMVVSSSTLAEMAHTLAKDAVHPPLYYFLLHMWLRLFGLGLVRVRLLSAVFGTGSVIVMYFLAKYLFERRTAVLSALILAVSQRNIMYSQEARMYTALLFFVLCSVFIFLVAIREKRAWAWWLSVVFVTLMIYTHYYGLFVAGILFVYAICRRKQEGTPAGWLIGGVALPLASLVPWLTSGVIGHVFHDRTSLPTSQPVWFQANWGSIFGAINRFNNGKLFGVFGPSPLWTYVVGAILFSLPALLALKLIVHRFKPDSLNRFQREALVLLAVLWQLPLAIVVGLGVFLKVQYDVRDVFFCVGPYYLLVARGISELKSTFLRSAWVILLLAYSGFSVRSIYFIPYKEDVRDTLTYLTREYRQGDCVISYASLPHPEEWLIYVGRQPDLRFSTVDAVASQPADCPRVWFIADRRVDESSRESDELVRTLEKTHEKIMEVVYFWREVDLLVLRK